MYNPSQASLNSGQDQLLKRESLFVPPAPYAPNLSPERPYSEIRSEYLRDMAAQYPNKAIYRYHNFEDHILTGEVYLKQLIIRCQREGVEVNPEVLDAAWNGHDAGYACDPTVLGFKSREHMHATIAYNSLKAKGASEEFARRVERAIACTNVFESPVTNEDKAIRATDMHNVALDYENMRDNSLRLYEEMRNTVSSNLSFPDFVRGSVKYLGLYMIPFLKLTTAAVDTEGRSEWHVKAFENVVRLRREHSSVPANILVAMGSALTPPELIERRGLAGGHECVIFGAPAELAKEYHAQGSRLARRWGSEAAVVCTPMNESAISLPQNCANEVLLGAEDCEQYLNEVERVLMPNGTLSIAADFKQMSLQRQISLEEILGAGGFELVSEDSDVHGCIYRYKRVASVSSNE